MDNAGEGGGGDLEDKLKYFKFERKSDKGQMKIQFRLKVRDASLYTDNLIRIKIRKMNKKKKKKKKQEDSRILKLFFF